MWAGLHHLKKGEEDVTLCNYNTNEQVLKEIFNW